MPGAGEAEEGTPEVAPLPSPVMDPGAVRSGLLATKEEVLAAIDARSADEYAVDHVSGAVNAPWLDTAHAEEGSACLARVQVRATYQEMRMTPGLRPITCCLTRARGYVAAFALRLAGFKDVMFCAGSWNEWSHDPDASVE